MSIRKEQEWQLTQMREIRAGGVRDDGVTPLSPEALVELDEAIAALEARLAA